MKTRYLYAFYAMIVVLSLWVGWRSLNAQGAMYFMRQAALGQYMGPADSQKILVEIVDYRCHPCRNLYPVIKEFHERNPDVKIVVKYLPVYLKPSINEAEIALASAMQGKFAAVHGRLMTQGDAALDDAGAAKMFQELDVNAAQLAQDRKRDEIGRELLTTLSALRVLKVRAVPALIIGKRVYAMDNGMPGVEDIEKMMNATYGTGQK